MSGGAPRFSVVDLLPSHKKVVRQAAVLLVEGFEEHWPDAWPDVEAALEEVRESLGEGVMPDANGPGKPDIYMAKRCL